LDPEEIFWENIGSSTLKNFMKWIGTFILTITLFLISFFGIWGIS